MNIQDEKPFKELMLMIASTWGKPVTGAKSKAWWTVFKQYDFADLEAGVFKHMADKIKGGYDPTPANVLLHMPEPKKTLQIQDKGGLTCCDNTKRLVDKYHPVTGSYFKTSITNTDNLEIKK
jgi:hypothetical protein